MLVTTLFILAALFIEGYEKFAHKNLWLIILCFDIAFISLIALDFGRRKKVLMNYICLVIYTLTGSYSVSCTITFKTPEMVLQAFCTLTIFVGSLCVYVVTTKTDFTS